MLDSIAKLLPLLTVVGGTAASSDNIKGQIQKLLTATQVVATQYEVNEIAHMVHLDVIGEQAPKPENFEIYLQKSLSMMNKIKRDPSKDLWGTSYGLIYDEKDRRLYVLSAGPNKQFNDGDDVWASFEY